MEMVVPNAPLKMTSCQQEGMASSGGKHKLAEDCEALSPMDKLRHKLLEAISRDDVSTATQLLNDLDIDFSELNEHNTLLACAAQHCPGICKVLVEKGADINLGTGRVCQTPLMFAASCNTESCKNLLALGADVNRTDKLKKTALEYAASCNSDVGTECCRLLHQYGVDINRAGWRGETPLMYAVSHNVATCEFLLAAGADINKTNNGGGTALGSAASCDIEVGAECCKILLEHGADVNKQSRHGESPLHMAAQRNVSAISILLGAGADVNAYTVWGVGGRQPLHCAAMHCPEACQLLLDAGADVNAPLKGREEPAIFFADPSCYQVLIDAGANSVNFQCKKTGESILHKACGFAGHVEMVKTLLKAGVDIKARDYNGQTALHRAACHDAVKCKILVDAGIPFDVRDSHGSYPIHLATASDKVELIQFFIDKGSTVDETDNEMNTPLHTAAKNGSAAVIEFLITNGAAVNARNSDSWTPLHIATMSHPNATKALLDGGADIEAKTMDGVLPLHCAAKSPSTSSVQHLIDKGAAIDVTDKTGWTALHYAALHSAEHVKVLLQAGANPKISTNCGRTVHDFTYVESEVRDILATLSSGGTHDAQE